MIPRLSLNKHLHPSLSPHLTADSSSVIYLEQLLRDSLALRILEIPNVTMQPLQFSGATPVKLAILFSGGLDCTVLARLAHDILPASQAIDLLNVAFENPRVHKTNGTETGAGTDFFELCPDRITGRASLVELRRVCPTRAWRFVAINVPYSETQEHRPIVISLMHPHNTEMDLSISLALYFAARGLGQTCTGDIHHGLATYTSPARVLLSGLGADELFAGYTRHATAFRRNGFPGLLNEVELDVSRLGKRNLGRDDRVISHWGREARFPFLDENVVGWALQAEMPQKCGFGEEGGAGNDTSESLEAGKKVLRCLAWKLGMEGVAKEKKRAVSCIGLLAQLLNPLIWATDPIWRSDREDGDRENERHIDTELKSSIGPNATVRAVSLHVRSLPQHTHYRQ